MTGCRRGTRKHCAGEGGDPGWGRGNNIGDAGHREHAAPGNPQKIAGSEVAPQGDPMSTLQGSGSDEARRNRMVDRQLVGRGITDPQVLAAMRKVPRHLFVAAALAEMAYDDRPLPIGNRQTISQPYMVALMAEALALEGGEKVLEIGTGSGYSAAVVAEIASEVYTIERLAPLADKANDTLKTLGYENVHVRCADGTLGWPEAAPFDAIVVTAGAPSVPDTLKQQLKTGGRLVIPVESDYGLQTLVRETRRSEDKFDVEDLGGVRFVPLIGEEGWHPPEDQGDGDCGAP